MDNYQLGREVADFAEMNPERFNMTTWGRLEACGTVACLAGTTMILSGYKLHEGLFYRPDGTRVLYEDSEALHLLGMTVEETIGRVGEEDRIWFDYANGLDRFKKLVEESEGRAAAC